jgi:hypothetical protein
MNVRTVKRYRAKIRESAQAWIARLAKSKRGDYIAQYRERIYEVMAYQRELWNICNNKETFERIKVEALSKLLDCTKQLVELYDAMPLISSIRDYGCGHSVQLDEVYYDKGSEKSRAKLLEEYSKAIDALTINEENRLRKKVEELTVRSDQIDELRSAVAI